MIILGLKEVEKWDESLVKAAGSMFGALQETLSTRSVSKESWLQDHRLPDCVDLTQSLEQLEVSKYTRQ